MRRPHDSSEMKHHKHQYSPQSSAGGTFSRVKRFFTVSLGGRQPPPEPRSLEPMPSPSSQIISGLQLEGLRAEAEAVLGRSLRELMREEKGHSHGVPVLVHDICCHMLTHGVDYSILVADHWCPDRAAILESLPQTLDAEISSASEMHSAAAAGLFRLFLQELPHPLLNRDAAAALSRLSKELEGLDENRHIELYQDVAMRIRSFLCRRVPSYNLNFLQFVVTFLHQLRTANHNTCPVTPSALSRLLGRVLTEAGMKDGGDPITFRLAEVLLLNHAVIFRDPVNLQQDASYSSDSVSSNCDSRGETTDDADLFTPEDDDDGDDTSGPGMSGGADGEDDSTTTTTDTDDFRSPPVSPIKRDSDHYSMPSTSSPGNIRSSDELQDREEYLSKIGPYGKEYLPSITGLLTSSYEPWNFDGFRCKDTSADLHVPSAESSCISGEEISELESDGDRDADGSDTEGAPGAGGAPCPHEERRSSERFFHRGHHSSSTGRKAKRKLRRKHSKDSSSRVQSSEEEERDQPSVFASLLSRDEDPAPFDPTPPDTSQPFRTLIASDEPVCSSDRSAWGAREESFVDNWQRTIPLYSRNDDETSIKPTNWYRTEDDENDSSMAAPLGEDTRPRPIGHSAVKLLTKNVNAIKRKIKKYEEEFEKSFGYRPSHSDKLKHKEVKKYMHDLSKAKKELKQMKDDLPEKRSKNTTKPFSISLLRCQEATAIPNTFDPIPKAPATTPVSSQQTKETYRQMEECLNVKRAGAKRPTKVGELSMEQLKEEKIDIQKALLFYESKHGRPSTREDKELVRPLYDRYRLVKRSVNKLSVRPKENVIELAPILEHVVMDFTLASPQHRGSLKEDECTEDEDDLPSSQFPMNPDPHPEVVPAAPSPAVEVNLGDLHALPIHELKERKKEARDEKRKLRHSLREVEERFERETGRKMQKEDRGPLEKNYNEYKHVKAKLRLLEALLSKHGH